MQSWKKALRVVDRFEEFFCSILLLVLVALLFWQVLARFIFDTGMSASEELSRFIFVFFVLLAMSYGAKQRIHVRVTVLVGLLPAKFRRIVIFLADLLWIAFNCYVIYYGFVFVNRMIAAPRVTPIMRVNMAWIYLSLPLAFALTNIRIILHLIAGNTDLMTAEREAEEAIAEAKAELDLPEEQNLSTENK